jgi:4-hydroxy-3-methylbut-2-enyl diphosphate reductase
VLNATEATEVCTYIRHGGDRQRFLERFGHAASAGFDPALDLTRVGLANQTTMLMTESLEVESMFRAAMRDRYGETALADHFRAFDTICSATQDRQDAVVALLDQQPLDLMIVVGGYNSSNTCNLARLCAERLPTFHIASPDCLESDRTIRHRALDSKVEVRTQGWLPGGAIAIGLTAGASTPDNHVGMTIEALARVTEGVVE